DVSRQWCRPINEVYMTKTTKETVGYKKPPRATQFKPGVSGNPTGRPKKPVNIASELLDELSELTSIRDHGRQIEITKARAIVKEIVRLAAAGDLRAATTVLSFTRNQTDTAERSDEPTHSDLDVIDNFVDRELRRRAANSSSKSDCNTDIKG